MPHNPIFVASHSPSEGASPRSRTAIRSGTAIATIATALLLATPAQAANECGVLPGGGGTLVCDSVDNPFPDGIYYDISTGTDDLNLVLGDTVLVQGNSTLFAAVDIFGGVSDITVQLDGSIDASGATVRGLNIQTTDGDGTLTGNGTIATLGEFADGIFASATGTGNTSVSLTEADPMTGRIDTDGIGSAGVRTAANSGDTVIDVTTIATRQNGSRGTSATSTSGAISITSTGSISTLGTNDVDAGDSRAVYADAGGDGAVTIDVATVSTQGEDADAIYAKSYSGDVNVTANGAVSTRGVEADAIRAGSETGSVTVLAAGVTTYGDNSEGIQATIESGSGTVSVTAYGAVSTTGYDSDAVVAEAYDGNIDITTGNVSTLGERADGVSGESNAGDILVTTTNGSVTTEGRNSDGIDVETYAGSIAIYAGDVTTKGRLSDAIIAVAEGGVEIEAAVIRTENDNARGIYASSRESDVEIETTGLMTTLGSESDGIYAIAANGSIAITAADVSTTGYNADGIDADASSGTVTVTAADVSTKGQYSEAILVRAYGDATVTAAEISTEGESAEGVNVESSYGNVSITTTGLVSTLGVEAEGIDAEAPDGTITITAADVSTTGYGSDAVRAIGAYDIVISTGALSTEGQEAEGVYADSKDGNVSVTTTELVQTTGDYADGIFAEALFDVTIAAGSVSTVGFNADGVFIKSFAGDVSVTTTGPVTTLGSDSHGIYVNADTGSVTVNAGDVSTVGSVSEAIFASARGDVTVTAANISAEGESAEGVNVRSDSGNISITTTGLVSTLGFDAEGIDAEIAAGTGTITIVAADISTTGDEAEAIIATNIYGDVSISANTVSTAGNDAEAILAQADNGNASVTATGLVSTIGFESEGIVVDAYRGSASVVAADVSTRGADAEAIFVRSEADATVTAANISTAGDGAAGVDLETFFDNVSITTTGLVSTLGNDAQGIDAEAQAGTITIVAADVSTKGNDSEAILVRAYEDATVTAANISAEGESAEGVNVKSTYGDVSITTTGLVSTLGFEAEGIDAEAPAGTITIVAADVSTAGDESEGIITSYADGDVTISANAVSTAGADAEAILAQSDNGNVSVTTTGLVSTTGYASDGIEVNALNGSASVMAADISTEGEGAVAILVRAEGDASVTAGSLTTQGLRAGAIDVAAETGSISITATGPITTSGEEAHGVRAVSTSGAVSVSTAGVSTSGADSTAILATSGGPVSVTANGAVTTAYGDAIIATSDGDVTVAIGPEGDVTGAGNGVVATTTGGDIVISNEGVMSSGGGFALVGTGGAVSFVNAGTVNGAIQTGAFDDMITNDGLFAATSDSDFGDGADSFNNRRTVAVEGAITFIGLERFENSGTVSTVNGGIGDSLILPGDYHGGFGTLALDVNFEGDGMADTLVIGGAATGDTSVLITPVGGLPAFAPNTDFFQSILIVDAGDGSNSDAFSLPGGQFDRGLLSYRISFDAPNDDYYLEASLSNSAFQVPEIGTAATSLWYRSADAWNAHMTSRRDSNAAPRSPIWMQAYAANTSRDDTLTTMQSLANQSASYDYDQNYYGFQFGYESRLGTENWVGGITTGYLTSHLGFDGTADQVRFEDINLGAYVGYRSGGLHANLLAKWDFLEADIISGSAGYRADTLGDSYGARFDLAYRWESGNFFVEPVATIEYQVADWENYSVLGAMVDIENVEGLRGQLGLRIGGTTPIGGAASRLTYYLGGHYMREFDSEGTASLTSTSSTQHVVSDGHANYGRFEAGISILTRSGLSGFIEANGDVGGNYVGVGGRAGLRLVF